MRRAVVGAVILAAALSSPANAGPSSPLTVPSGYPPGGEKQNPVEQQSDWPWLPGPLDCSGDTNCVINPLPCAWDVDDHWQVIEMNRTLGSGASTSGTFCQVYDANPQYRTINGMTAWWSNNRARLGVRLTAPVSTLVVTVTVEPQGRTFVAHAVPAGSRFAYEFCGHAVYDPGDPVLGPISGSAGGPYNSDGIGIPSGITLSISNPSSKNVRDITLDIQGVGTGQGGASCIQNPTYEQQQHDYPFTWTQS